MPPRHLRTFTTGAVASVALAVTGSAVLSAHQGGQAALETSSAREAASAPATVVAPDTSAITTRRGQAVSTKVKDAALRTATLTDIPPEALAAYQRAADSIQGADPECGVPWTVLAGIGQVESDHGRTSSRNAKGIVGVPLDGHGVKAVADTDGGKLDGDAKFDRAVGPMQILPSTWAVVAVDGDGDGKRDPQDLDDAALGAAVYLCGSGQDLATEAGQRVALRTYNNSASYVDLVMSVAAAYAKDQSATYSLAGMQTGGVDFRSVGTTFTGGGTDAGDVPAAKKAGKQETTRAEAAAPGSATKSPAPTSTKPGSSDDRTGGTKTGTGAQGGDQSPVAQTTTVPTDLVGMSYTAAKAELEAKKLVAAQGAGYYDPSAEGTVLAATKAGQSVASGSTVTLNASLGPVADVVGKTYADAKAALEAQGLVVATSGADATDLAVVTAQTPDHLAKGGTVTLTLAAPAADPTPAPDE